MARISNLTSASGRKYLINENGFRPGTPQYIDRDYVYNYIPDPVLGGTNILTAGDDKMIGENEVCLSFTVEVPVRVFIIYADKLRALPKWLQSWKDTREKVTRADSNAASLKGIFTLFAKDFQPGLVEINGNLSPEMARDPKFIAAGPLGTNYCMYSLVIVPTS